MVESHMESHAAVSPDRSKWLLQPHRLKSTLRPVLFSASPWHTPRGRDDSQVIDDFLLRNSWGFGEWDDCETNNGLDHSPHSRIKAPMRIRNL